MANKTIADLAAGAAVSSSDLFETSQSGASKKVDAAALKTFMQTGLTMTGALERKATADIASDTTTDLGTATTNTVRITGTSTINSFGVAAAGVERDVRFQGVLTLTYNATSMILPGAANITTAAGDTATFKSEGGGNWRCWRYQRAATAP